MRNTLNSPIVKKVFMAATGLFLVSFLLIHLSINLMLLVPDGGDTFNQAAHFMATNPMIKVMEPVLAIGFLLHLIFAAVVNRQNLKASPNAYAKTNTTSSTWASRNMYALGVILLATMIVHLINFWVKIKLHAAVDNLPMLGYKTVDGVEMENVFVLVKTCFSYWYYCLIYVVMAVALYYHVSHGFWSAFQSLGANTSKTKKFLVSLSKVIAFIIGFGFTIIPVIYFINNSCGLNIY